MTKICLVVGGKEYLSDCLTALPGCEADANNLFAAFVDDVHSDYDQEESICLISPTIEDVNRSFDRLLEIKVPIEVFTFAYSGHGGVRHNSLFLCTKDTVPTKLSTTALSLSNIFTFIAELRPGHTNVIIDACESGGVVFNLKSLIDPNLFGASNTPGLSVLAAAASDQSAGEDASGGFVSSAIVDCLCGTNRVQANRPFLNLIEVGDHVSKIISDQG